LALGVQTAFQRGSQPLANFDASQNKLVTVGSASIGLQPAVHNSAGSDSPTIRSAKKTVVRAGRALYDQPVPNMCRTCLRPAVLSLPELHQYVDLAAPYQPPGGGPGVVAAQAV